MQQHHADSCQCAKLSWNAVVESWFITISDRIYFHQLKLQAQQVLNEQASKIYAYFEANMSKQKSIVICKVMRVDIINLKPANSLRTWFREISWHFEKLKAPISVYFNCWFPLTTADSLWQWQTFPSISWGLIFAYLYQPGSEKEGLALQARSGFVWVAAWWPQGLLHPCLESRHLHRKGQIKST